MNTREFPTSPMLLARAAGLCYLLIIAGALFIPFTVAPSGISGMQLEPGASPMIPRIEANRALYLTSGAAQLFVLACDVVVALLLYELLRPVSRALSLMAAGFRLVFSAIAGANVVNHFAALIVLSGPGHLDAFSADRMHALATAFLKLRTIGLDIALVFFGIHLALLGYLLYRSGYFPRALGLLLSVGGGVGYIANIFVHVLSPSVRESTFPYVMLPAGAAELWLAIWLVVVGVNQSKWEVAVRGSG